jgi:hypothetical protein
MDTSPKKRRETPEFYGYIPPTGRGLIFLLMMVNSSAHFLAKTMAIALLAAVSKTWTLGYIVGDFGLFIIYTLVRNDFIYWIPIQSYIGTIAVSLTERCCDKVRRQCGVGDDARHLFLLVNRTIRPLATTQL